jgi:hypothetical protein
MQRKSRAIPANGLSWRELAQYYPELLPLQLEVRLTKRLSVDQLAREITQILKPLGKKPGTPERVARHIATVLAPRFRILSTELDKLIANRPAEFAAALDASQMDEYTRLVKIISTFPMPKKIRAKQQLSEEQKQRNVKTSKNSYERRKRRHYPRREVGLIEEEFGTPRFSPLFPDAAPTGPCLDTLFEFGGVSMSQGADSLERLFGMDRHRFPKSLSNYRYRRGRRFFYDLRAVLECMHQLLESGRWPSDIERRKLVLSGIVQRAKYIGKPKVAALLEAFFRPYLV